jgi:NAD(P)H dehydrogenase (quinone)
MIAITAATGQLGRLVLKQLLAKLPASQLVAIVRDPAKAGDIAAWGVTVRQADYGDVAGLASAMTGADKLLFISSSEVGRRVQQHANVVEAARRAGVGLLVYTSLLHADTSSLSLAPEHVATESAIHASGLPFVILRNGWYAENHTAALPAALAQGALVGSAGDGRISMAARADYGEAAAAVLLGGDHAGRVYELAGDTAHTLGELAAELSRQTGRDLPYHDLPEAEYRAILIRAGLPEPLASGIASWDIGASRGALRHDGRELSRLIGRPTATLAECVRRALAGA